MKNYILSVILACAAFTVKAQTSSGIHHIKYLEINTANSDYSVDFFDDDKIIFAASTTDRILKSSKFQAHIDLFEGEVNEEGQILNKVRTKGIATKKIVKTGAAFSNDRKTVYFTAKKYSKRKPKKMIPSELFKAEIDSEGYWINTAKVAINQKGYTIENPSLNIDETKLYFSANLPGTLGGKDIFVVDINEDGTFGKPVNLGNKINTPKDEITPFIADNNFLYYSSNGKEDSFGSFDIYASEAFDNTVSESLHLDSPINSINDDFAYIVKSDKGYFSSNRLQGQDNNDIYSFYIEPDKPEECYQQVIGTVRDEESEKVLPEATIDVINDEGEKVDSLVSDENGNYTYNLACRGTFTFRATKKDYSIEEHIINTANYTEAPSLEVNQSLKYNFKEVKDKVVINVNPIYFGFDKWNINNDAATELDKIVEIMRENTDLMIESGSHTDSRGTKAYNQILSERRAKATVDYIVSKGIDASRIKSKGYGEGQLLNDCGDGVRCKIQDHKLNRRTEFVLVNKQANNYRKVRQAEAVVAERSEEESPPKENETEKVIENSTELPQETKEAEKIESAKENIDDTVKDKEDSTNAKEVQSTKKDKSSVIEEVVVEDRALKDIMIKDFKNPIFEEKQKIETEIIYSPSITVVDNQENDIERQGSSEINKGTTNVYKEILSSSPNIEPGIYDLATLIKGKTTNGKNISNTTEEALTNASSSLDKKATTIISDDTNTHPIVDKLSSDRPIQSEKKGTLIPQNSSFQNIERGSKSEQSDEKSNIDAAANKLFNDDEESDDFVESGFSRDLNDKITIVDYDKNPKKEETSVRKIIAKQRDEFKKEYVSNVKSINKEEVLNINTIDVSPIMIRNNGKYATTQRSNQVDVMRINFQIDNNKYITAGYKEVYILIQNPAGTILNRKGTFKVNNGKELTYTEKTNAYYNNNHLNISMVTDRFIQRIIKGVYTITIYIEGYPVGLEMVELS